MSLTAFAPAKVNLYLHVGPLAADGFHPVSSLMVFADVGDEVRAGQAAARIHFPDSPWRQPLTVHFEIDALVLCKRALAPCERGDCLYQLGTDLD